MGVIVIAFFGFILLFIGGVAFLIIWVVKKSLTPKTAEYIADEKSQMQNRISEMKRDLADWSSYSHEDITSAMIYKRKKTTSQTLKGKIYADDRKPIVAFDRVERGMAANGYMFASTTEFDLYYDIRVDEFTIKYDNELLGEIKKSGNIVDDKGKTIGHAKHPIKASFNVAFVKKRMGENTFPLTMNGRKLATIHVAPNYGDSGPATTIAAVFNENIWGNSILEMHDTPTDYEIKWLRALAIMETAFHGHWLI